MGFHLPSSFSSFFIVSLWEGCPPQQTSHAVSSARIRSHSHLRTNYRTINWKSKSRCSQSSYPSELSPRLTGLEAVGGERRYNWIPLALLSSCKWSPSEKGRLKSETLPPTGREKPVSKQRSYWNHSRPQLPGPWTLNTTPTLCPQEPGQWLLKYQK